MFTAVTLPLSTACDATVGGGDQRRQLYLGDFEARDVGVIVKVVAVLGASQSVSGAPEEENRLLVIWEMSMLGMMAQ